MSEQQFPPQVLAGRVFAISIAAIVGWIAAAFWFVILRHP